jgi:hypothetical protein
MGMTYSDDGLSPGFKKRESHPASRYGLAVKELFNEQ